MKLVLGLWDADQEALLGEEIRSALRAAGATRLQVNLDDDHIPATVLRLLHFEKPLTTVVSVWTESESDHANESSGIVEALRPYAARLAGWRVEERHPLVPPTVPDGERLDGLAQVAFLRRPPTLSYTDWQQHWQGPHTRIAIETQATFGYVQNRVLGKLTEDTPDVDAVVEELFPAEAMTDIHAFYGSAGDQAELDRRLSLLLASVATMGADHDLDVVPTSRHTWDLPPIRSSTPDWDPRSVQVLTDQVTAYDDLRRTCPVAHSDYLDWSLLGHADVLASAQDDTTFSSVVSTHLSVPNGMDPPEHAAYRSIVDRYFTSDLMAEFEPGCREVTRALVEELPRDRELDFMQHFARPLALRLQSRWLGWTAELHQPLHDWTLKNHRATLARDRDAMAAVALEFDSFIEELIADRRRLGDDAPADLTTQLLGERLEGRPLTDPEIVSILRNWTVGELSTIAASVGIVAHFLAGRFDVAATLRDQPDLIDTAVDEILRRTPPLIANRRVTTRDVEVGGRRLGAGERVTLLWASANRDESVFGDPDEFRLDRDPQENLLYGAGIHVCPGAPLSRLELRVLVEELLAGVSELTLGGRPTLAAYPASGFSELPLVVGQVP